MISLDLFTLATSVHAIAVAAGERILQLYGAQADWKADGSPVTEADQAAQEIIVGGLLALTPDIPILSEEAAEISYDQRRTWRRLWVVDPLDGTKEFLKQSGEFTVNIALVEDTRPVLGVVHAPAIRTSWIGFRGEAPRVERDGISSTISCLRQTESPVRLVVSRDHLGPEEKALVEFLDPTESLSAGSALKFCLVAEGKADLYPRFVPTMEWDTAAAQAVLEAAGGKVTDTSGSPLAYNRETLRNPPILAWADASLFERVRSFIASR